MKHTTLIALVALFAVAGAISAFYLVRGLKEGRIGLKFNFPYRTEPYPDGREPGYAYRNHSPGLFWNEIGVEVFAVAVCIFMIFIIITAL